ncbi:acyltransferase family protein [Paraburkholderia sp. RL17-347-BIC-D]|uniref:acyltransferase family protein n=1 Tax=Paraburkholderia sp. RL17-347-BIC-D TaxID=3031632 RepID=UPI0038BC5AC6
MKTTNTKNLSLEGLRGLACVSVFSCHFLYVFFPYLARGRALDQAGFVLVWHWETWLSSAPFTLLYNGDFAVSVFFVLSGYVLTRKFWKTGDIASLTAGAVKRYPRLIFPAAASIAFALLLMRLGWIRASDIPDASFAGWARATYQHVPSIRAALHAAFVGVAFRGDPATLAWNGPLWTLAIEFWGSIALFAAFALFPRHKAVATIAFTIWACISPSTVYFMPFIAGALLNGAIDWLKKRSGVSTLLFIIGMVLGSYDYTGWYDWMTAIVPAHLDHRAFWYAFGAMFTVAGVLGSRPIDAFFGSNIPVYFGRISFSMYLLHWPLVFSFSIWAVERYQLLGISYMPAVWAAYLSSALLLVMLSEAFYRIVDRPSMRAADVLSAWVLGTPNRRVKSLIHEG